MQKLICMDWKRAYGPARIWPSNLGEQNGVLGLHHSAMSLRHCPWHSLELTAGSSKGLRAAWAFKVCVFMEFESNYDIAATAEFIHSHNFRRVALQVRPSSSTIHDIQSNQFAPLIVLSCLVTEKLKGKKWLRLCKV